MTSFLPCFGSPFNTKAPPVRKVIAHAYAIGTCLSVYYGFYFNTKSKNQRYQVMLSPK